MRLKYKFCIFKILPWHRIGFKFFWNVLLGKQLHSNDGKYVYNDNQHERQIAESSNR